MFDLCVKNGLIWNAEGSFAGDVYVKDGAIAVLAEHGSDLEALKVVDAAGKYVMPGFVDPHAHLNDPGMTESEDFYTGTCSAAAGGITTVVEHPLTDPLPSGPLPFEEKREICGGKAVVDFALFGACTPENMSEVEQMARLGAVAMKAFLPYSVEIPQLLDDDLIRHMENLKGKGPVFCVHCENDRLVRGFTQEQERLGRIGPGDYEAGRPEIAELEAVSRIGLFALHTGAKVHIVHCSVPEAVRAVSEYRKRGADLTVETCTHFLTLDQSEVERLGVFGICNPPLRCRETVEELWAEVLAGRVDFIGSDHATYTFEEKEAGLENVFRTPAGLSGIQTCFPMFYEEAVNQRGMKTERFVEMSSTAAAKRFGLYPRKGAIAPGADGDLVIFDPHECWTVEEERLFYKMKWTPYMGRRIRGKVAATILRGTVVYEDGTILAEPGCGVFVKRSDR